MIIKEMRASFGRLSGESLTLHEGLNIIKSPNESGKSSWCAFIRAMFYGIDSSERAKAGFLPDKQRYAPWSGAPMEGSMTLSHGGRDITLRRSTKAANAPMREFSAVLTGTEEPVPDLLGGSCGEQLLGVSKEVFRRSAFIEQGAVAVSGSEELSQRIASIVSSGEEDSSFAAADKRLREWQRKRKYNNRGEIPELEASIAQAEKALRLINAHESDKLLYLREKESRDAETKNLEQSLLAERKRAREELSSRLAAARERESAAQAALNSKTAEAERARAALFTGPFAGLEPEGARARAGEDVLRAGQLSQETQRSASRLGYIVLFMLCLCSLVAGIFTVKFMFIPALAFAAGAFLLYRRGMEAIRASGRAQEELRELLSKYGAESAEGITSALDAFTESFYAAEKAAQERERAEQSLLSAQNEVAQLTARAVENAPTPEEERLSRKLENARALAANAARRLAETEGAGGTLGDPMAIESGLLADRARKEELEFQYEALAIAIKTLQRADKEIQSRFSPALGRLAGEYMSRMTEGRYTELSLARDFSAAARTQGDSVAHPASYLSAGALDLLYLAVRLAVCELALPQEEPCPLVLDDALVNLDPERERAALSLLEEIAQKRQVILFSCK